MEEDEALKICIRKWALKCAHTHKIAIPAKIIGNVLREFPHYKERRKELIKLMRGICIKVNKMKDKDIRKEMERHSFEETIVYETDSYGS
ncbi:MAG: hypothetical protein ABIH83_04990 [Candidatus Micrarchaeota archaeon]